MSKRLKITAIGWMKILLFTFNVIIIGVAISLLVVANNIYKMVPKTSFFDQNLGDEYIAPMSKLSLLIVFVTFGMISIGVVGVINLFIGWKAITEIYVWALILGATVMIALGIECFIVAKYVSDEISVQMEMMIFQHSSYWTPMAKAQLKFKCCGISDEAAMKKMKERRYANCCESQSTSGCPESSIFKTHCDEIDVTQPVPMITAFAPYLMLFAAYCLPVVVLTVLLNVLLIKRKKNRRKKKAGPPQAPPRDPSRQKRTSEGTEAEEGKKREEKEEREKKEGIEEEEGKKREEEERKKREEEERKKIKEERKKKKEERKKKKEERKKKKEERKKRKEEKEERKRKEGIEGEEGKIREGKERKRNEGTEGKERKKKAETQEKERKKREEKVSPERAKKGSPADD